MNLINGKCEWDDYEMVGVSVGNGSSYLWRAGWGAGKMGQNLVTTAAALRVDWLTLVNGTTLALCVADPAAG